MKLLIRQPLHGMTKCELKSKKLQKELGERVPAFFTIGGKMDDFNSDNESICGYGVSNGYLSVR